MLLSFHFTHRTEFICRYPTSSSSFFFFFPHPRIAVVTGANKGIGFEICRQLASNGIRVVLTARDVRRGNEAIEKLKAAGCSDVVFHQLDVMDPTTISSLADFIKTHFGKLDILVMQLRALYIHLWRDSKCYFWEGRGIWKEISSNVVYVLWILGFDNLLLIMLQRIYRISEESFMGFEFKNIHPCIGWFGGHQISLFKNK